MPDALGMFNKAFDGSGAMDYVVPNLNLNVEEIQL
jgi:hypothetical protein